MQLEPSRNGTLGGINTTGIIGIDESDDSSVNKMMIDYCGDNDDDDNDLNDKL